GAAGELLQLLVEALGAFLGVKLLPRLRKPRGSLGHHTGAGGHDEVAIGVSLAAFPDHLLLASIDPANGINHQLHDRVKQLPLRPPVRPRGGPPKGRIEKGRLVDVFGPVGNEADPHLASRNFGSKLLRQEVGRDGASHTPADDDDIVHDAYPPLTLTASLAGPTGDDASRGRFLLPE